MSNRPKVGLSKFYLLTHPFFTASRMPVHSKEEIDARNVVVRASVRAWHWLVDKAASEPGSALIVVSAGDLGKLNHLWNEFSGYAREKLGDRFFRASKADKLLPGYAHKFSETAFYGTMKGKHFKFSENGVAIEGFGEPNAHDCLKEDMRTLEAYLARRKIRVLNSTINSKIKMPSSNRAREIGVRLRKRPWSARHQTSAKPNSTPRKHRG